MTTLPRSHSRLKFWLRLGLALGFSFLLGIGVLSKAIATPVAPAAIASAPSSPSQPLRIATRVIPPFVLKEQGQLAGFSVELWQKVAEQMNVPSNWQMYSTLPEMLAAVKNNQADLAIAAISITSERIQQFDFSYPMFAAGLQVMVRHPKMNQGIPKVIRELFSPALLQLVALAFVMVAIASHIIWWLERGHPETMISKAYFPGIFEAAWWAAATLATQADQMPRGVLGRLTAIFWMFTAVIFVAYFTATVTTGMTVDKLQGEITGLQDLAGRQIATIKGSTAAEFLKTERLRAQEFAKIEETYTALLDNQVDAIVFDSPVLMYYACNEGNGKVQVVGDIFKDENYGILLPLNSPHRQAINESLLALKEDGSYQELYDRWFKPKV